MIKKKSLTFIFLIICFLTVILRWQSWWTPINRDEGGYAYVASELNTSEFVPYRDAFEHKPPLINWIYRLGFNIMGENQFAVRSLGFFASIATSFIFFLIVRRVGPTLVLVFFSNTLFLSGSGSNVEIFLSPLLLLAYLFITKNRAFFAGLILGIAFVLKPVAGTNILFAYLLVKKRVMFTAGWLAAPVALMLYQLNTPGFIDFINAVVGYNTLYVQSGFSTLNNNDNFFRFLVFPDPVLVVICVGLVILIIKNTSLIRLSPRQLIWLLATFLGAKVLSREAEHYYYPLLASLGLVFVEFPFSKLKKLMIISLALYFFIHFRFVFTSPKTALLSVMGHTTIQSYHAREIGIKAKSVALDGDVAHVSLVGEPQILFYSGLPSANRCFNTFCLGFYVDAPKYILSSLDKKPVVVVAYPGLIPGFEDKLKTMGYYSDLTTYFAPVYWRPDAAKKLGL